MVIVAAERGWGRFDLIVSGIRLKKGGGHDGVFYVFLCLISLILMGYRRLTWS